MIKLQSIVKKYDKSEKMAVNHVTVDIKEGEFFVLVGPSGCGKSTLLRMIAGIESISDGQLFINSKEANHLDPKDRMLSMVFQNYALYPHLNVEENILFGLKVRKVPKNERKKRLEDAVKTVGLTEYLHAKPRELSGGQRQRVALARAIVSQAPICLMDEPLSNLDAKLRGQMRIELKEIQQQLGITMVYVTHDQIEAMTMGDRIMVMKDGELQQVGEPLEIYNKPSNEFVASFIGSPSMNLTDSEVKGKQLFIGNERILLEEHQLKHLNDGPVRFGIRPEHVEISDKGVEVTIQSVEILGTETILNFRMNNDIWSIKLFGQSSLKRGDKIRIRLQPEKMMFFDYHTKKIIQ